MSNGSELRRALRRGLRRAEPSARLVDWTLLVLVAFQVGSGLLSFTVGRPSGAVVFWAHGVAGFALVFFLALKLYRVRRRVTDSRLWTRATGLSVALAVVAVAALATGVAWVLGADVDLAYWGLMNVHVLFGLLLVPLLALHLLSRRSLPGMRRPRRSDVQGRRDALRYAGVLVGGAVLWRSQSVVNDLLDTAGTTRRFTGSKPVDLDSEGVDGADGRTDGEFPVTSWVADDPDPVDRDAWRLRVDGLVDESLDLSYAALTGVAPEDGDATGDGDATDATSDDATDATGDDGETELRALLDCTSGWYTVQDWRGVRLGDLLDAAGVGDDARYVRVVSVTGYRWSFPVSEAREFLLATGVAGDDLSHGHGAPLRLVAPGRRGFQWVKWVDRVELRERRDPAQWLVTLISGFD
ncbi:molybdopterin-dependent oxidoreductase [Halobium salinum]|uniref:Molybdopterin-dependent oxidoreductase n=1 Tax=Halobium salinum TaxID=1364940 RepID=A0ABD5P7A9_9EURY|nr:molybdopterin-dependent oxidoreductase [Halobium salinum]